MLLSGSEGKATIVLGLNAPAAHATLPALFRPMPCALGTAPEITSFSERLASSGGGAGGWES